MSAFESIDPCTGAVIWQGAAGDVGAAVARARAYIAAGDPPLVEPDGTQAARTRAKPMTNRSGASRARWWAGSWHLLEWMRQA